MRNKLGQMTGGAVITMYRIFLVSFVALIVLGMSTIFYSHTIEVRDIEAVIMSRAIANCIVGEDGVDVNSLEDIDLLSHCGYLKYQNRFYVRADFKDSSGNEVLKSTSGNIGAIFINQIFSRVGVSREEVYRAAPGYYKNNYPLLIEGGEVGEIDLEVIVLDEE